MVIGLDSTRPDAARPNLLPWNWKRYHAELLQRARPLPPLMRSTGAWSERVNHVDWLMPREFPLPLFRLVPRGDGTVRSETLAQAPFAFDRERRILAVEVRCGTIAHIARASLLTALIAAGAERRREFLGCALDESPTPRIAFVSWRALVGGPDDPAIEPEPDPAREAAGGEQPHGRTIRTPSLWTLMEQSLPFVSGEEAEPFDDFASLHTVDVEDVEEATPTQASSLALTTPRAPTLLVIDAIGAPIPYANAIIAIARKLVSLTRLFDAIAHPEIMTDARGRTNWTPTLVLSTNGHLPHERLEHATALDDLETGLFIDAPGTPAERLAFVTAWCRWRTPRAREGALARDAVHLCEQIETSLAALGLRAVERPPERRFTPAGATDLATFDIACAIGSTLRDGMPCSTPMQLLRGLDVRLPRKALDEARRALIAFHRGFALLQDVPSMEADGYAREYALLPETSFLQMSDVSLSELRETVNGLADLSPKQLELMKGSAVNALRRNPLLASLMRPDAGTGRGFVGIQLLNEPLAMAIIADDVMRDLENVQSTEQIAEIAHVALMMSPSAWTRFIEALFELFDERGLAYLARYVLDATYTALLLWSANTQMISETFDEGMEEIAGDISREEMQENLRQSDTLLKARIEAMRDTRYGDAVVRASLHHNLQTGGVVPPSWAHWVGSDLYQYELQEADGAVLPAPDTEATAEHVAYLRELLNAPAPACDNAALVLRAIGDGEAL